MTRFPSRVSRNSSNTKGSERKLASKAFGALAWYLWGVRNKALFEGIRFKQPADVFYKMIALQLGDSW